MAAAGTDTDWLELSPKSQFAVAPDAAPLTVNERLCPVLPVQMLLKKNAPPIVIERAEACGWSGACGWRSACAEEPEDACDTVNSAEGVAGPAD